MIKIDSISCHPDNRWTQIVVVGDPPRTSSRRDAMINRLASDYEIPKDQKFVGLHSDIKLGTLQFSWQAEERSGWFQWLKATLSKCSGIFQKNKSRLDKMPRIQSLRRYPDEHRTVIVMLGYPPPYNDSNDWQDSMVKKLAIDYQIPRDQKFAHLHSSIKLGTMRFVWSRPD